MKLDFVIGNPPYQEEMEGTSDNPVYNQFMDAAFTIGEKVELITPARFLFNAGKTPKSWNQKMLSDEHFKIVYYEPESWKVFSNTEIKGGVVVSYRDKNSNYGAIETFTRFPELNSILHKVKGQMQDSVSKIVFAPESYKFTAAMHKALPDVESLLSKGHAYDITSNIFDKLDGIVFFSDKPKDGKCYIRILGRKDNARVYMWIDKSFVAQHENLDKYKLFFPKSNGSGIFGEPMSSSVVGEPGIGHTQTFISMGAFDSEFEAESLMKYVKTKFARTMLGVLKVTQDNKKSVWNFVPLQDFTPSSDIDWSKSIAQIDQQLYRKYGLTDEEIAFIESHVKEMT